MTVPVYEVYKVGEDPRWVPGLDLLGAIGLRVALIPHYDNAEGGTHDTRFCYLGEDRLARLEARAARGRLRPRGRRAHRPRASTSTTERAEVAGHGGVTVRVRGRSARIETGETLDLAASWSWPPSWPRDTWPPGTSATGSGATAERRQPVRAPIADVRPRGATVGGAGVEGPPLLGAIRAHEESFRTARADADVAGMVGAVLALDDELWAWSADTLAVRRPRPGSGQPAGHGGRAR